MTDISPMQNGHTNRSVTDWRERSEDAARSEHFFAESIREAERRELSGEMGMVDLDDFLAGMASRRAERRMVGK